MLRADDDDKLAAQCESQHRGRLITVVCGRKTVGILRHRLRDVALLYLEGGEEGLLLLLPN